jgi:putative glycosyltransferase (exosortase G-associated)
MFKSGLIFWMGWMILPIIVEFIPAAGNFILLIAKKMRIDKKPVTGYFRPPVSIIIPVYNSSVTLEACIRSIDSSTYPNELIDVLCVDNGSRDDSFEVFQKCQNELIDLSMSWIVSASGKSKALNKAIFNSEGKYVINIDSDGKLEPMAIESVVKTFESDPEVDCVTGAILIEPALVDATPGGFLRVFRKLEFMEYCQAFLAGRNFQSETNTIFTLSGAFSALRKSVLSKTFMYNTDTICEDAHLTFQVKEILHRKVALCNNAIFMVDPIDNINKYYTQRQRWQIGELEVLKMFVLKWIL